MFWNDFLRCRGNTWTMCEFHDSNCNGFGDMWWTDICIYFSSTVVSSYLVQQPFCVWHYTTVSSSDSSLFVCFVASGFLAVISHSYHSALCLPTKHSQLSTNIITSVLFHTDYVQPPSSDSPNHVLSMWSTMMYLKMVKQAISCHK